MSGGEIRDIEGEFDCREIIADDLCKHICQCLLVYLLSKQSFNPPTLFGSDPILIVNLERVEGGSNLQTHDDIADVPCHDHGTATDLFGVVKWVKSATDAYGLAPCFGVDSLGAAAQDTMVELHA